MDGRGPPPRRGDETDDLDLVFEIRCLLLNFFKVLILLVNFPHNALQSTKLSSGRIQLCSLEKVDQHDHCQGYAHEPPGHQQFFATGRGPFDLSNRQEIDANHLSPGLRVASPTLTAKAEACC